ncbi:MULTISPECIES: hypothetical protein [Lentilactobacillus]|uniref:Uncharacterized protein n=1 Tax=Lentilactobacillus diolivorans TaxID=179838 RepID=A0ABQ0XGY7_9LACO|nr:MULTISPECIES: hypothetical protein [Lentilactobacillus]GEP25321.1 hypothetical protein LDI01_29140 [Lentilactobacillus diolivorans]
MIAELERWERSFLNDQNKAKKSKKIEQLLTDPWAVDIQGIWEQAAHNPDPDKRKLFDALHTYLLDKRQEQIINEKHFVI